MNKIVILLLLTCSYCCRAQQPNQNNLPVAMPDTVEAFNGEFDVYNNGLIYSPYTVQQLTHIVDSLNLKFKRCDLNKTFLSLRQGMAYYVSIDKKRTAEAAKDMEAGMNLEDISNKYATGPAENFQVVINKYEYGSKIYYEIKALQFNDHSGIAMSKTGKTDYTRIKLAGKWIAEEPEKEYAMGAFYFKEEPRAMPIPETYARMMLYSECVIDTTADIYTGPKDRDPFSRRWPHSDKGYKKTKQYAFEQYLEKNTDHITVPKIVKDYDGREYMVKDSMVKAYIRSTLSIQPAFREKLQEAVEEYNEGTTGSWDKFEYYVANYHSKKLALEMKRKRRVVGGCSMDQTPRIHAQQIAMLSAEAVNWETFLRAHLNIMNDRFDRASDGSWAWASRQTYIKELETLNIDVNDLLLGISLRSSNAADKHYYGNISRLGRALAETADKTTLVNTLTKAIADTKLDVYNRVLMFYLLNHYTYNLKEKQEKKAGYQLLLTAIKTLPAHVADNIKLDEKNY